MATVKDKLIRLAFEDPELRPVLLPLVKKRTKKAYTVDEEVVSQELYEMGRNDGASYKKKDAKGAIEKAARELTKNQARELRDTIREVKKEVVGELAKYWKKVDAS